MEYNFLTVINEMCKSPGASVTMFTGSTNLISAGDTKVGGWGYVSIAVANELVKKILDAKVAAQLIVFDVKEFGKTMKELGMEKPE